VYYRTHRLVWPWWGCHAGEREVLTFAHRCNILCARDKSQRLTGRVSLERWPRQHERLVGKHQSSTEPAHRQGAAGVLLLQKPIRILTTGHFFRDAHNQLHRDVGN
jgi:hypothetical protein